MVGQSIITLLMSGTTSLRAPHQLTTGLRGVLFYGQNQCYKSQGIENGHVMGGSVKILVVAGALCLAAPSVVRAQAPPQARLPAQAIPQGSPLPGIAPPTYPSAAPGLPPPPPVAPTAVNPALDVPISDVTIEGATAYSASAFSAATAGLTGPTVPVASIEAARTAILNRYRADGYVYTAVNARITATHLRLVVIEGRIVDVKLRGNIGPAGTQVLRFLNHLTQESPVTTAAIERWLLLANDIPGVQVRSTINPSTTDPGALTLIADVSRQQFSASIRADDRAFRQTGPEELLATIDANSFTSLGERTEISLYHTFNDTDTFGQASEEFFIGGSGLKLHIYGGAGEATPSGSLRELGYDGITRVFGASLSYPLIRSRQQTLTLIGLFDGLESQINYSVTGQSVRASFDSLRVLRAQAQYVLLDTWLAQFVGPDFEAVNHADLRVSQGLPDFGASTNGNTQLPRLNERVDFTKVDAELDRRQTIWSPYAGATVNLLIGANGQFTNNVLPPEEKFYLGGPNFNRGFYYGEVTGDRAVQTKFEPQFDTPIPTPSFIPSQLHAEIYAFYDWGEVWQQQRLDLDHTLRSLGGGVRFYADPYLEVDLEGVNRLTRTPDGLPPQVPALKSAEFYWQIVVHY
jgi:hemolysin activation/secretion protein